MASNLVLGIPPTINDLSQKGLIERAFHDGLHPNMMYRAEAMWENFEGNIGTETFQTRRGLLQPVTKPLAVGNSTPAVQSVPYEQWGVTINQFADSVETNVPTSAQASSNLFLSDIHELGRNGARSVNLIARNAIFKAYLSGQTSLLNATGTSDTTIRVASCNGFTDSLNLSLSARPQPVSASNPLPIKLGPTGSVTANVIAATPDDPSDAFGPGTLTLAAAIGSIVAQRAAVKTAYAPRILRPAGGSNVDSIGAGDFVTLQLCINAVSILRNNSVPPHADGYYHAHISPTTMSQLFADPVFQRAHQSLPEGETMRTGAVAMIAGIKFIMNNESPSQFNVGTLVSTGPNSAKYGPQIGADVVNDGGVAIARTIITGRGALYERTIDEKKLYVTEAGMNGVQGDFTIVNNNLQIDTSRIRLVIRAPIDPLQQVVTASWSISLDFPVPSDLTMPTGPERFKRAITLEHAA